MLDLMRRKQRGLKFILWLVIIGLGAGMLLLFVDVGGTGGPVLLGSNQSIASVDGLDINVNQFRNTYFNFYDSYRRYYNLDGSNLDILKALAIHEMALDKLIKDKIVQREANRMGLAVSQSEIVDALRKMPGVSENGRFIGRSRLEQILRANNTTLAEFEAGLVTELLSQKVRGVITDGVTVSDAEVRQNYLETTQTATLEYVAFKSEDSVGEVPVVESELKEYYEKTKEQYRVGEKRRIRYLQVNSADLSDQIEVSEQEIISAYNAEGDHDQVRARHILISIDDPDTESEARAKAEAVLADVRLGKDFAELARTHSQDEGSAANGGDLGFFQRGQMVPEFSNAAFSLAPGSISDLVRSQYGFHIIKVEERRTESVDARRSTLEFQLRTQKAESLAETRANEAVAAIRNNQDIEKVAAELGLEIRESGFFESTGVIPVLGSVPALQSEVFAMNEFGEIGTPHKASLGFVVPQYVEKQESFIPEFPEVRDAVLTGYKKEKSVVLAESKAGRFVERVRGGASLTATAKSMNVEVVKTDPFARRGFIDDLLGQTASILDLAFELPLNTPSDSIKVYEDFVVIQVVARDAFDETKFTAEKHLIRERLEAQKKLDLFQAYLENLDRRLRKSERILVNQALIDQIVG